MFRFRTLKLIFMILFIPVLSVISQEYTDENIIDIISNFEDFDSSAAQLSGVEFSKTDPDVISFYRQIEDYRQLYLYNLKDKNPPRQISTSSKIDDEDFLFEEEISRNNYFEGEIAWAPKKFRSGVDTRYYDWFAFVGSGEGTNWDLYLTSTNPDEKIIRLTNDRAVESQPIWSPDGNQIAFVSGRSGKGDIYLIDDIDQIITYYNSRLGGKGKIYEEIAENLEEEFFKESADSSDVKRYRIIQITDTGKEEFNPVFSSDGEFIAFTAKADDEVRGESANYGISIVKLSSLGSPKRFTTNPGSESRPVWTEDGYILYYASRDIQSVRQDLFAAKFTGFGEESEPFRIAAHVSPEGAKPVDVTYSMDNSLAVYKIYDKEEDIYKIMVSPVKRRSGESDVLFQQVSAINNIAVNDNRFAVTRQDGSDFKISKGISQFLSDPMNKVKLENVKVKRSRNLLYYIGGAGALGVIAAILLGGGGDDGPPVIPPTGSGATLGTPPNPNSN